MRHPRIARSRSFFRALSLAVAMVLILGLGWLNAPQPAAAQDDELVDAGVSDNAYESPTYGYTLEWDEDIWAVADAESSDDGDFLHLTSDASNFYLESFARFDGDPADCLENAVAFIEDDDRVSEFEPLLDDDDEPIASEDDTAASSTYSYVFTDGGDEQDITQRFECRVLVEGEAVLQIDHLAPSDDFETESGLVADVLDTVVIPGQPSEDDEAAPTEDTDEPTDTSDDEDTASDDEDAEPTEEATSDDADTEDDAASDEEEPGTEDEPADEIDPDDLAGVDGDSYTSPTYDYSIEWDGDQWQPTLATSEDDIDTLVLENDVTVLTIAGTAEFGENLDRCVRSARRALEGQDGIADLSATLDADDEPIEIDEDDRAGALYTVEFDDEDEPDQIAQIECRVAVPGEAVIQIVQLSPSRQFNGQIDPVSEILDSITLADDADDADQDDPITDDVDQDNDEPDTEDDTAESTVDGNSYVSPNFGYSVEWDEDVWTFDNSQGDSESSGPGFDTLFLASDNSGLGIIGSELPDPETCITEYASLIRSNSEGDIDNWAPFEDEDGEQIEGERDGGSFAAFTFTVTERGQEIEIVNYFECRTVVDGESVVLFYMTTSPAAYDDALDELGDLLESLVLPDEDADAADESTQDDEGDSEPPANDDEDSEADGDSTADATDLDTYTDPDFPFTVTWDESVWTVIDQRTLGDGHNLINLTAEGTGDLTIEGWGRWEGVPSDCLNDLTLNLRAVDGVQDFGRVRETDLYPENTAPGSAYALYSYTLAPEGRTPVDYYVYLECRTVVDGEAVVVITLLVSADEYDAVRPLIEPVLASIQIEE